MAIPIMNIMIIAVTLSLAGYVSDISLDVLNLGKLEIMQNTITDQQSVLSTGNGYIDSNIVTNASDAEKALAYTHVQLLDIIANFTLVEEQDNNITISSNTTELILLYEELVRDVASLESAFVTITNNVVTIQKNLTIDNVGIINLKSSVTGLINTFNTTENTILQLNANITTMFAFLQYLNFTGNISLIESNIASLDVNLTLIQEDSIFIESNLTLIYDLVSALGMDISNLELFSSITELEDTLAATAGTVGLIGSGGELISVNNATLSTEVLLSLIDNSNFHESPMYLNLPDPAVFYVEKDIRILYPAGFSVSILSSKGMLVLDINHMSTEVIFLPQLGWTILHDESPRFVPYEQLGSKLVTNATNSGAGLGRSVALSCDGLTLVVGAPSDKSGMGSIVIFNRTSWNVPFSVPGIRLLGINASTSAGIGGVVDISCDGTVVVTAGYEDTERISNQNYLVGAVWVFSLTGSSWAQQGSKITPYSGNNAYGGSLFGFSLAISGDGTMFVAGGIGDGGPNCGGSETASIGAMWVYRKNTLGNWVNVGGKLNEPSVCGCADLYGWSVSTNYNGAIIVFGAPNWQSSSSATQTGGIFIWEYNLVLAGYISALPYTSFPDNSMAGTSLSMSADGCTIVVGAPGYVSGSNTGGFAVILKSGDTWANGPAAVLPDGGMYTPDVVSFSGFASKVRISQDASTVMATATGSSGYGLWTFTATTTTVGSVSYQQAGSKLVATDSSDTSYGASVAMNTDGGIAAVGIPADTGGNGAVAIMI